jgi:glycosidase
MATTPWPNQPIIYEINTWVWLYELSQEQGRDITLANIPEKEWETIASLGVDAVWFMGVWERSPRGIQIANQNQGLLVDFHRVLADFTEADNVGSPYCVRRYVVDEHLGGPEGLANARKELADRGMRLMLDFVPNHVAPDHPWIFEHPEYFIQGNGDDLARDPASFIETGEKVFACGRDPYFPAWPDVLQLNAFNDGLRGAAIDTLVSVGDQCDGVRCDMAMLMLNNIFERTWGARAGARPEIDYWPEVIGGVHKKHPTLLFMAEAYWDLEWELQQQGFDYCYDKRLYDRLEHDSAEMVRLHLLADLAYQGKLVRFIENHDEPRAAAAFLPQKQRAAAVVITTIPGAKLLHEGQLEGRKVRPPVFLRRRPVEPFDHKLQVFYRQLLPVVCEAGFQDADWRLCERTGWSDNTSFLNLVAWCRQNVGERWLVVVNLSNRASQALVHIPWDDLRGRTWRLTDLLSGATYEHDATAILDSGLYVALDPWGFHFLAWQASQ